MQTRKREHHLHTRDNGRMSPTYVSWTSMKQRCTNKKHVAYIKYHSTTVCDRWMNSFNTFLEDMGERPSGMTLDRINPFGNYEPSNCKWSTNKEQCNNFRKHYVLFRGDTYHIDELCLKFNISKKRVHSRLYAGWSLEDAIATDFSQIYKDKPSYKNFILPDIHRISQMKWLREKGCTYKNIGECFGVSKQRIKQAIG